MPKIRFLKESKSSSLCVESGCSMGTTPLVKEADRQREGTTI
jgi:hypothetical protein